MKETKRRYNLVAFFSLFGLIGCVIPAHSAQTSQNAITFADVLKWTSDDEPTRFILRQITERKVSFVLTDEQTKALNKAWKQTKGEDLPPAIAASLKSNYVLPKVSLKIACLKECRLLINDRDVARASMDTPFKTELDPGDITIIAKAPGYQDQKRVVSLKVGQPGNELFDQFVAAGGGIKVNCEPEGFQMLLDGKPVTAEQLAVPNTSVGDHLILIQKKGWVPYSRTVSISPGDTKELNIKLVRLIDVPELKVIRSDQRTDGIIRDELRIGDRNLFEPFNLNRVSEGLNYEAHGSFLLRVRAATEKGTIKETVLNGLITWEITPELGSAYSPVILKYRMGSPLQIICEEKDKQFASAFSPYIKKMLELNPYSVMKRLWQGGGTPRLEWWDESSVKPIAGDSKDWWKAGPLRLIAEYPDQRSEIKISKPVDAEFIVATELRYIPKNSGTAEVMRIEYNQYEGSNPYWPTVIIAYPAFDSGDLFKIDYDGSPKIIAGTKKQSPN